MGEENPQKKGREDLRLQEEFLRQSDEDEMDTAMTSPPIQITSPPHVI